MTKRNLYLAALLILVICWGAGAEPGIIATLILGAVYLVSLPDAAGGPPVTVTRRAPQDQ